MERITGGQGTPRGCRWVEVALPCARVSIGQVAPVARRREIERAILGDVVHRACDDAILKYRLVAVGDVVRDDVAMIGIAEQANVIGEAVYAVECRGEKELYSG